MVSTTIYKETIFLGSSLKIIRNFPGSAKQRIGNEIHRLQCGSNPTDLKPISEIGAGVYEIRANVEKRWFRAFYVAKFDEAIFVLHAFEKKTNKISRRDIEAGKAAYKVLIRRRIREARDD